MNDQQILEFAMAHHRAGHLAEAEALYRQLLAAHPGHPDVTHLLGVVAHHAGRLGEARELMRQAIAASPQRPHYHSNLGLLLLDLGELEAAGEAFETTIRLDPSLAEAHYNLGNLRWKQGNRPRAIEAYRAALRCRPAYEPAFLNLAAVLSDAGRTGEAIDTLRTAIEQVPQSAPLRNNLGNLLREEGELDAAIETYRAALNCESSRSITASNLGNALKDRGQLDEAIAWFRRSLQLDPTPEVQSNLILALHYHPEGTRQLPAVMRAWRDRFAAPVARNFSFPNDRSPERRLRLGYLSPDLRDHVVGRALLPVFQRHDHERFEVFCYSESPVRDALGEQFCAHADHWRTTETLSDERIATQIREDGIDVLVDLALHTAFNRLLVLARKPAPVQAAWLGYPGATGLDTVDYAISDSQLDPPGLNADYYAEQPLLLPDCWTCYAPPADSPAPGDLPASRNGFVTFGSCNNLAKITDGVLATWARILRETERSRLRFLAKAGTHRVRIAEVLQREGVTPDRVEFLDYLPASVTAPGDQAQHRFLSRYQEIDIALDSFPYNGMTTTCDALWMGVPVIALTGKLPVSRASFSLLSTVGVPEFAADSIDGYVRKAVDLAHDWPRLAGLRHALRSQMSASPLLDTERFVRNLEAAYREMWRRWCGR